MPVSLKNLLIPRNTEGGLLSLVHQCSSAISYTRGTWLLLGQLRVDRACSVTRCLLSLWPWWGQLTSQNLRSPPPTEGNGSSVPHGGKGASLEVVKDLVIVIQRCRPDRKRTFSAGIREKYSLVSICGKMS